jgi:Mrp family chromosome partitioning ATPase
MSGGCELELRSDQGPMSKNFELLQQIGSDEELFQTAMNSKDAGMAVDLEVASVLGEEALERAMERASLIDLFQTSNDTLEETRGQRTEPGSDAGLESSRRKRVCEGAADALRTPRNPTSPIGDLGMITESRVAQNVAQIGSLPFKLLAEDKPKDISATASEEPPSVPRVNVQQKTRQDMSLPRPWLDSLKRTAKRWHWKEKVRSNQDGPDLEGITREQEMKLVERVFPGAATDSPRVALFAGLGNDAGCAATCARVAELLAARAEGPVCVVDANFQTPSLHEYFGVDNLKGFAEATVESGPLQSFAQQIAERGLWLISSGNANVQRRFPAMADGLRVRIEELRETFKYVVIHSAPLRLETSAMLLSRSTDGVVLVVEAHGTRRDAARRVKGMLEAANVRLLGVVLNNRTFPIPEPIYRRL